MNWASLVACVVWVTLQGLRRPLFLARANMGEDVEVVQPVEVMICGWEYLVAVFSALWLLSVNFSVFLTLLMPIIPF